MASKNKDVNPLHKKKPKGHKPAHANTFAFIHNANSRKTKKILSSPNVGLCRRCTAKIEWRKKYRKYKPLTKPGVCQYCHQKEVKAAYHKSCTPCAKSLEICAFCCKKWKDLNNEDEDDATHIDNEEDGEFDEEEEEDQAIHDDGLAAEETDTTPMHMCLEVQAPFAQAIITGKKSVETRTYALPEEFLHQPISIIETVYSDEFAADSKKLPEVVPFGSQGGSARTNWEGWKYGEPKVLPSMKITHMVTFKSCWLYPDEKSFIDDRDRHCVPEDSAFNVYTDASPVYGWEVETVSESPYANMDIPHMVRHHRSLFLVKHTSAPIPPPPPVMTPEMPPTMPSTHIRDKNIYGRAPVVNINKK